MDELVITNLSCVCVCVCVCGFCPSGEVQVIVHYGRIALDFRWSLHGRDGALLRRAPRDLYQHDGHRRHAY